MRSKPRKNANEPLDHILFSGPPGLGKTTLAHIIAHEMGADIRSTTGPVLEKPGDIAALFTPLKQGDILFIDEIHRINPIVEEVLYPAMEDFFIDVMIGEGPSARSIKLNLEHFTLIGATTKQGLLGAPFRDRFGITSRLDLYTPGDLVRIVTRSAGDPEDPHHSGRSRGDCETEPRHSPDCQPVTAEGEGLCHGQRGWHDNAGDYRRCPCHDADRRTRS